MVGVDAGILIVGMAVPQSLLNATLVEEQDQPTGINVRPTLVCFTHPLSFTWGCSCFHFTFTGGREKC